MQIAQRKSGRAVLATSDRHHPPGGPTVTRQVDLYGLSWSDRLHRLMAAYRLTQARLAAVIGLSAPMLSQLISGQRVKISNPAVYGRVVGLEEQLAHPGVQAGDPAVLAKVLDEVAASHPALTTMTMRQDYSAGSGERPGMDGDDSLPARLSTMASSDQLRETARAAVAGGAAALGAVLDRAAELSGG